ncbi:MAG TPA: hypothetical protein VJP41_07350 [Gaiellaceae bacterium]|nr:hypothetical protein [Gaiellaceae bacterium]
MKRLLALLLPPRSRKTRNRIDSEHLDRVYRETHRQVEDLRKAA